MAVDKRVKREIKGLFYFYWRNFLFKIKTNFFYWNVWCKNKEIDEKKNILIHIQASGISLLQKVKNRLLTEIITL